jgi:ubiquitin C-terminal hydrolase
MKRRKTSAPVKESDLVRPADQPYSTLQDPIWCFEDHKYKKNCGNNPWCLNHFIDRKKGIWKVVPACINSLGTDPALSKRDQLGNSTALTPCGLQNLGATCYLNVLVQMLFQNLNTRNAFFNMNTEDKETGQGQC